MRKKITKKKSKPTFDYEPRFESSNSAFRKAYTESYWKAASPRQVAREFLRFLSENGYYVFRNQETSQKDPTAISHDELAEKFGRSVER